MRVNLGVDIPYGTVLTTTDELSRHLRRAQQMHDSPAFADFDLLCKELLSADFSGLYDNIPRQDLIRVLKAMSRWIFAYVTKARRDMKDTFTPGSTHGAMRLLIPQYHEQKKLNARWVKGNVPPAKLEGYVLVDAETLGDWCQIVIDNSYFTFGGKVWQMVEGFPMGIPSGPSFADVYLAYYEFIFALRKFEEVRATGVPLSSGMKYLLLLLRRYIDDIFAIVDKGSEEWKDWIWDERKGGGSDGIYPTHLVNTAGVVVERPMALTLEPGQMARYLDLLIEIRTHGGVTRLRHRMYDKRSEMKAFAGMRKFPHRSSVLDGLVKSRVIDNEIARYDKRNSGVAGLRTDVVDYAVSRLEHGYDLATILKRISVYRKDQKGNWAESRKVITQRVTAAAARVQINPESVVPFDE